MKKQLLFLTLIFSLIFCNVFAQAVYVTKTGKKYHTENCRYLSKSSYSMSLANARTSGYDACSVCKPSTVTKTSLSDPTPTNKRETKNYKAPTSQTSQSMQCSGTTKKGAQCGRMTKSSNGKCWQHGGN